MRAAAGCWRGVPMTPTGAPMEGVVDLAGAPPITIRSVHPRPPVSKAAEPEWRAAIEALPGGDGRILAGDFNATLRPPRVPRAARPRLRRRRGRRRRRAEADVARTAAPTTRAAADHRPHPRRPPDPRRARHRGADPAQRPPRGDRRPALTLRQVRSLAAALVVALFSVPLAVMVLGALHAPGQPPPVGLGDRPERPVARRVRARLRPRPARAPAAQLADDRGDRGAAHGRLRVAHRLRDHAAAPPLARDRDRLHARLPDDPGLGAVGPALRDLPLARTCSTPTCR